MRGDKVAVGLLLAWIAWCLGGLGEPARHWLPVLAGVGEIEAGWLTVEGLLVALLRAAGMLAATLVFGGATARLGRPLLRIWALPGVQPGERLSLEVLLGFAAMGLWFFGLGLTGLFYAPLLAAAVPVALAFPGLRRDLARLGTAVRDLRPAWIWLAFAPLAIAGAVALAPDVYVDTYAYHLAAPEMFLKEHRFIWTAIQVPLSAELIYALGLAIDQPALPHLLQAVPFLAAVALVAAWAGRLGGAGAGALAAVLILTLGETERQLLLAKNNLAASAYPIAGMVAALRGLGGKPVRSSWLLLSGTLFGCGAGHKWSGYPLLALGWAATEMLLRARRRGTARMTLAWLLMAGVPLVPWLGRTWLQMGNPLWPFLSSWWPGALWDPESTRALKILRAAEVPSSGLLVFVPHWVRWWLLHQPAVAALLPLCLVRFASLPGEVRILLAYGAVGYAALWVLIPGDARHLGLSVLAMWAAATGVVAARWASAWPGPRRLAGMLAVAALAWLPLGFALRDLSPAPFVRCLFGGIDQRGYLAERLTTYGEMSGDLRGRPGLDGVIALGEDPQFYRLPGRYRGQRFLGRNWAWVLARESFTPEDIRRRLRQLNCRHVIYNFVTEGFPHRETAAYEWDDRMLRLWEDFVGRNLAVAVPPRHVDHANGGWCIYELGREPLPRAPAYLPYLPGIAALYFRVTRKGFEEDIQAWDTAARELQARFPHVDYINDMLALTYRVRRQWKAAYDFFLPGVTHGTVNDSNYWNMAIMAANLGKWREAYRWMNRAWELYPSLRGDAERALQRLRRILVAQERGSDIPPE